MNGLTRLNQFLQLLKKRKISYQLMQSRADAIEVSFALVGERYEVEFFEDREEICVFRGDEGPTEDMAPVLKKIDDFV